MLSQVSRHTLVVLDILGRLPQKLNLLRIESLQPSCSSRYPGAKLCSWVLFQPEIQMQLAAIHIVIAVH